MVMLLLRNGANPMILNQEGFSGIHLAAQMGQTAIMAYLIGKGMDPNFPDKTGMTPLAW